MTQATDFAQPAGNRPAGKNAPVIVNHRYRAHIPGTPGARSYSRASTIAKTLSDPYHLTRWEIRMAMLGILARDDLATLARTCDPDTAEGKEALNDIGRQAKEAARGSAGANLGTAFHTVTELIETDRADRVPPELAVEANAYVARMTASGVRPYLLERQIFCGGLGDGVIGRFDRLYWMGEMLGIADAKTAKNVGFGWLDIAIQLAIYAHADYIYDPETDAWEDAPPIRHDIAVVQHSLIGTDRCDLYVVNIEAGWELAKLAVRVRQARSDKAALAGALTPEEQIPPATLAHAVGTADSRQRLMKLWDWGQRLGTWTDEVHVIALQRVAELDRQTGI